MAFLIGDPEFWSITEQGLRDRVGDPSRRQHGPDHRWLPGIHPHDTPTSLLIAITTDATCGYLTSGSARQSSQGVGRPPGCTRSHGDIPIQRGGCGPATGATCPTSSITSTRLPSPRASGRVPLSLATSRALTAFAYSGDPNHDELPRWPSYDPGGSVDHALRHTLIGRTRSLWGRAPLLGRSLSRRSLSGRAL